MDSDQAPAVQYAPNLQRISALDTARGVAVLGILLINMYSFAMPQVMRFNPLLMVDAGGADRAIWYFLHVFADTKFITMLSLIFGASLWFFGEHKSGDDPSVADRLQFRRSMWLVVFGLLHGYLLWDGDVLFTYAVCALIVWHWREWSDGLLLKVIVVLLIILAMSSLVIVAAFPELMSEWSTSDAIAEEIALYQQGWMAIAPERFQRAIESQFGVILSGWFSLAVMLVGVVLARCGFLSLQVGADAYRRLIVITFAPGLMLIAVGLAKSSQLGFAAAYTYTWGYELHFWGSTLMGISYLLMVMLWCQVGRGTFVRRILAAVGRMALSIYIMQSVICTLLFYGYGLSWYGELSLVQIMLVVVCIWVFQCMFACWWLMRFDYGPLEWLWRHLVYRNISNLRG